MDASAKAAAPVSERLRRMDCCIAQSLLPLTVAADITCSHWVESSCLGVRTLERPTATPIATTQSIAKDFPALPQAFFARPAELVAPDLIGCLLVKRQEDGSLLWGVVVETEGDS